MIQSLRHTSVTSRGGYRREGEGGEGWGAWLCARCRAARVKNAAREEAARGLAELCSPVSVATCGRELCCARRCCPRCGPRDGRRPRGTRDRSRTIRTTPTDWWYLLLLHAFYTRVWLVSASGNIFVNIFIYCLLFVCVSLSLALTFGILCFRF